MDINVKITLDLSTETVELFKGLFSGIAKAATEKIAKEKTPVIPLATGTTAQTTDGPITIEQVRAAVQEKAQDGKRTELKALLTEFGADKVTSLDADKYAEFLTKVKAL